MFSVLGDEVKGRNIANRGNSLISKLGYQGSQHEIKNHHDADEKEDIDTIFPEHHFNLATKLTQSQIKFCNSVAFLYFCFFMRMKLNWDAVGITATLACAIHCALLPLVLTSLPLFGVNIIHNVYFEAAMIFLALLIGSYSLYHGFRRHHHSYRPIIIFMIGMGLLVLKQFFLHVQYWLLIPAVLLIVFGHLDNYRSCRVHNHAHADDCNH